MKRSKVLFPLTLAVTVIGLASIVAQAQTGGQAASQSVQKLEGSWLVEVTLADPPPGVPNQVLALRTFTANGSMIETASLAGSTSGHGEWVRTGNRRFRADWTFFGFGQDGELVGLQRISETIVLAPRGDRFSGTGTMRMVGHDGTVLASGAATTVGVRLGVE